MQQDFIINNWSVWPPAEQDATTESELLSFIPKMLKRRLSPLAKIVFCAAKMCLKEHQNVVTVFSSTHGELAKSFNMMEQIEQGEEISPTAFSLSVHNAISGLFSIVYKNQLENTVVAPGEEGIASAFIEALGLLSEGEKQVLIVFYDEPLVEFYPSDPFKLSVDYSLAIALLISNTGSGTPVRLSCLPQTGEQGEQPVQLALLNKFLLQDQQSMVVATPRHSWNWRKIC